MSEKSWSAAALVTIAAVAMTGAGWLGGCAGGGRAPAAPGAVGLEGVERWSAGEGAGLYVYGETVVAYPPDDRGAYVVELERTPAGDAARGRLPAGASEDVVGHDGHVVRLTAEEQAALAATAGVRTVRPLQPDERRAPAALALAGSEADASAVRRPVRIDLLVGASEAEAAAVAAWIDAHGGTVEWRGESALTASVPPSAVAMVARLSPVRWVE